MTLKHILPFTGERPEAVFFDWDDTLSKHRHISIALMGELMERMGSQSEPPIAPEDLLLAWYTNKERCIATYFPGHSLEELSAVYRNMMDAHPIEETELFDDTRNILSALKEKNVRMAIVSDKSQERLEAEIRCTGLADFFEVIIGHKDGAKKKPNFEPILKAMRMMDLPMGSPVWFAGDAHVDVMASRSHGFRRFHVGEFLRDLMHARTDGPVTTLDTIGDLQEYINQIPEKSAKFRQGGLLA